MRPQLVQDIGENRPDRWQSPDDSRLPTGELHRRRTENPLLQDVRAKDAAKRITSTSQ